jgi:hypothetical protein
MTDHRGRAVNDPVTYTCLLTLLENNGKFDGFTFAFSRALYS